jgi:hypothetical protein
MFLPTDSFSFVFGDPNTFEYTPGYASSLTKSYVDFVYNQLVSGATHNLGALLAPASVKYIILATPNPNTLWNGAAALIAPLQPYLIGPIRYTSSGVQGDPINIEKVLDEQTDLKLVYNDTDFQVYENVMYLPKISVFASATYIVGSEDALSILPRMPNFSANADMLIFADQNPSLAKELPEVSSSILFFNTDISNYSNLLSSNVGSGNVYENAMNAFNSKKQLYLFAQDSPTFSRSITTPSGQWWIALKAPEALLLDPSMGFINLDQGQSFNITSENFKPAHDPPIYDFDLANYYFYTSAGGNFTIKIQGSGALWAYVAYNSTLSNIGEAPFVHVSLPDNGTFTINLPANTIIQPIVDAYNPAMGLSTPDNISEIFIEHNVGGNNSIINVDGIRINSAQTSDVDGWDIFGPVNMNPGTHDLAITNGVNGSLVAMYNTANLTDIFGEKTAIDYNYSTPSETDYNVNINTNASVFLSLSESYYPNWFAYSVGKQLVHFTGFSYSNAFYVNDTGSGDLYVNITYEPPLLNYFYVMQQVLFGTLGLIAIALLIIYRIKHRARA